MFLKTTINFMLSGVLMLAMTACGSTFDKAAMDKVKRVAVIGYTMDYHMSISQGIGSALMGGEKDMGGMGKMENKLKETRVSKASYDHIVKQLKAVGWQVASPSKVANSPSVKSFYNRNVKTGFLPLQSYHERYRRNGVPQYHYLGGQRGKGLFGKIAKELNVDAIILFYADTNISNSLITKTKYSTRLMIDVLDPRTDKYILRMGSNGEEIKEKDVLGKFDSVTEYNSYQGFAKATDKLVNDIKTKIK